MTLIPARLAPSRVLVGQGPLRTDSSKIPRLVLLAWLALFVNVLAPGGNPTVIPIPRPLLQAVAQGSLALALTFALLANRRIVIRPNLFMTLLTVLAVSSLVVSLAQRVHRGVGLPRRPAPRVRDLPVVADPVVGAS